MLTRFFFAFTFCTLLSSNLHLAHAQTTPSNSSSPWIGIFQPLPQYATPDGKAPDEKLVTLGKRLFLDTQFSINKSQSCNTCHRLDTFGVDNEATSAGHKGERGARNSPSVYNAALHFVQFWDGRAKDVEEQALGPVLNPVEMGMPSEVEVLKRIREDKDYPSLFAAAFPADKDPITFANFGKAIGAFERTLLTPSRFDDFLKGNDKALNEQELRGLTLFRDTGCVSCHMGVGLGGAMFQKLGLVHPYQSKDLGRYEATKVETDKFLFKVPSLRNVEKTGPYFHDGSVKTLEEAVTLMAWHQLGRKLEKAQVDDIVAFLRTLTGTPQTE
jgi:cytochrome c peroxidase